MPGRGTPHHSFRLPDVWWERLADAAKAQGTTRQEVLKAFTLWYCGVPGAELPERPDPTSGVGDSGSS